VGGANGRNPIAVIIPCHRVVASQGLGGYTGGVDLKRWLLEHESGDEGSLFGGLRAGF
jgi:methylated-DNA-[protein]-cysteine S-methyltransferase